MPRPDVQWERQPAAEQLVRELVDDFLARCPEAATLARRMRDETGTRFVDWVDHICVPDSAGIQDRLPLVGYTRVAQPPDAKERVFRDDEYVHAGGVFPPIKVRASGPGFYSPLEVAVKVESLADFAAIHQPQNDIEGGPLSRFRTLWLASAGSREREDESLLTIVERHAYRGFRTADPEPEQTVLRLHHLEEFRSRRRYLGIGEDAFELVEGLVDSAIEDVGRAWACDLFFAAEREYWQRRNRAAQFQKARQDRLGLGWANHDHHTYRSSRRHFARLIGLWEKLGFELRERFYAGAEAGWGAQICEHPECGIVTFNDVDLSPDELVADFAHDPLPERHALGTVGLWCALHGESILQAGMHHLECQFDFDALKAQMESEANIKVMKPFTDLPHLRQAFTEGERWPVKEERIAALLAKNQITPEQADTFRKNGAIGSHLENLERNEGFKGFNQKGVSDIIARTDPRNLL
ncbi:MAG TPA: hypothetical protein VEA69_13095 [Tepidisphaeraceae bacterium]|nr:hypothetical protein [Tepidisphaeraceae bacterium]